MGKSATISPRRMTKPDIGLFTKITWLKRDKECIKNMKTPLKGKLVMAVKPARFP